MRLKELENELYAGTLTSIQREEKCKTLIGKTIELSGRIGDIDEKRIAVYNWSSDYFGPENDCNSDHLFHFLYYDKKRFGQQMFTLSSGDGVNITATIKRLEGSYSTHCDLDLVSIEKINTLEEREKMRIAEQKKEKGCFVATACYENYYAPEVLVLRQFRDEKLLKTFFGKVFVKFYYSVSPSVAKRISKSDLLKKSIRQYLLEPLIKYIQQKNKR